MRDIRDGNSSALPNRMNDSRSLETPEFQHPPERAINRYVSNEMGPVRKRKLNSHLEQCAECRARVAKIRELARRFRDLERAALANAAQAYSIAS